MDGIIIVDKPQDWTSFDVCAKIRNLSKTQKVGHSGTLDPMATGLLILFLGSATKSIDKFLNGDKGYEAEMTLGVTTDTLDATGKILTLIPSESALADEDRVREIFKKYVGEIEQIPPMYSAKKVKGKKLYELARKGIEIEREAKKITIYELKLHELLGSKCKFYVHCSKGTYVRQLVSDMGDDLGCGAHLSALRRVYSKPFHIAEALTIDTLVNLAKIGKLDSVVLPVNDFINSPPNPLS